MARLLHKYVDVACWFTIGAVSMTTPLTLCSGRMPFECQWGTKVHMQPRIPGPADMGRHHRQLDWHVHMYVAAPGYTQELKPDTEEERA